MGDSFQTVFGELIVINKELVKLKIKDNLSVKIKNGMQFRDFFIELIDDEVGILVDARDVKADVTVNSMRFFTTDAAFNRKCKFQAIVVNSISIRLIANFYVSYLKYKSNAKVFNNNDDALLWLEDQVEFLNN
jgi:hypothetical protein